MNLNQFINPQQLSTLRSLARNSEEKEFFKDKLVEIKKLISTMPKTCETDGQEETQVVLHYFIGAYDWWIIEKDMEPDQLQAFGFACLGDAQNAKLGYISIVELLENNVELDLYFTPCSLSKIKNGLK